MRLQLNFLRAAFRGHGQEKDLWRAIQTAIDEGDRAFVQDHIQDVLALEGLKARHVEKSRDGGTTLTKSYLLYRLAVRAIFHRQHNIVKDVYKAIEVEKPQDENLRQFFGIKDFDRLVTTAIEVGDVDTFKIVFPYNNEKAANYVLDCYGDQKRTILQECLWHALKGRARNQGREHEADIAMHILSLPGVNVLSMNAIGKSEGVEGIRSGEIMHATSLALELSVRHGVRGPEDIIIQKIKERKEAVNNLTELREEVLALVTPAAHACGQAPEELVCRTLGIA